MVVVFDEFQQILEYGNDQVERKLRSETAEEGLRLLLCGFVANR